MLILNYSGLVIAIMFAARLGFWLHRVDAWWQAADGAKQDPIAH